ncbi:uncharacterized protein PV09_02815 [Verruconis gallopava]|uniref:Uncharacterized protein n=1 Tax=Verruconis gallopava TaxID=253628 RepID=A0A0D2AHF1_9PEZI|nr:uncharacterized protein PV09_02815 [Verruconis gallopava]KIW06353.1 hypothetical protein PV09_02815 [Verruconis gallopava]
MLKNILGWFLGVLFTIWFLRKQRELLVEVSKMGTNASSLDDVLPNPSRRDIYHVAFLLQQRLPPELIPRILDYAEYWLRSTVKVRQPMEVSDLRVLTWRTEYIVPGVTYLSTLPIGQCPGDEDGVALVGQHPVRKVVFTVESQDQGWSDYRDDHGTERGSWTWFEAVVREPGQLVYQDLLRSSMDALSSEEQRRATLPQPPTGRLIYKNLHAEGRWRRYVRTWSIFDEDDEIKTWILELKRGQIIDLTVWARFPGWRNRVAGAKIDVYLAAVR